MIYSTEEEKETEIFLDLIINTGLQYKTETFNFLLTTPYCAIWLYKLHLYLKIPKYCAFSTVGIQLSFLAVVTE